MLFSSTYYTKKSSKYENKWLSKVVKIIKKDFFKISVIMSTSISFFFKGSEPEPTKSINGSATLIKMWKSAHARR